MRFISMKHFRSPVAIRRVVGNRETIVLGQIVGEVNGSLRKTGRLADGTIVESDVLLGDFEGVCYERQAELEAAGKPGDGAVLTAEAVYMPKWFAEAVVAKLASNKRIEFAVEILVMPTPEGQAIQYQYDVRSLIARPSDSPVERLKRALAGKGVLRLPAPQALDPNARVALGHGGTDHGAETAHDPETGEITAESEGGFPEPADESDAATTDNPVTRARDKKHAAAK